MKAAQHMNNQRYDVLVVVCHSALHILYFSFITRKASGLALRLACWISIDIFEAKTPAVSSLMQVSCAYSVLEQKVIALSRCY